LDDYYSILGLDAGASARSIKVAYRRLAREVHPDRIMALPEAARDASSIQMAQLNEAYSVLSDAGRRREYDEKMRVGRLLDKKNGGVATATSKDSPPSANRPARIRPNSEFDSTVVTEFSKHLRTKLLANRKTLAWKPQDLEGFEWALQASNWRTHYCVAVRTFVAADSAAAKKLINYSEIAAATGRRSLRKSYFLFLLPFQKVSEWDLVSAKCQQFVTTCGAKWSNAHIEIALIDMTRGRTVRFGKHTREHRFEELLQLIATSS
jgi:hypothetical protein